MQRGYLPSTEFLASVGVRLEESQQPALAQREESPFDSDERAPPEDRRLWGAVGRPAFAPFPGDLSGLIFDAAEDGIGLIAAAETIEMGPDAQGLTPVHLQPEAGPDLGEVRGPGRTAQQDRAGSVVGAGDEHTVAEDQGGHGVDRVVHPGPEPPAEEHPAVVRIQDRQALTGQGMDHPAAVDAGGEGEACGFEESGG